MTWLDILVFVVVIASFVRGLKTGLVIQVASFAGIVLGTIFAGKVAEVIYPYLLKHIEVSENIISPLSYLIGFVLILIVVNLIGKFVHSMVNVVFLGMINRIIGAVFCVGKWMLILGIMLSLVVRIDVDKSIVKEKVRVESHTYPVLMDIAQKIIPYLRFDNFLSPTTLPAQDSPQLQSVSL